MSKREKRSGYDRRGVGWVKVVRRPLKAEEKQVLRGLNGRISNAADVGMLLRRAVRRSVGEASWVVHLNNYAQVRDMTKVGVGKADMVLVTPEQIYRAAIILQASAIILVHNHPTGALDPSRSDLETTISVIRAGQIVGIPCIDHVIVADKGYCSIVDYFVHVHVRRNDIPKALEQELKNLCHVLPGQRASEYC